jgi:hypothetical protein
MTKISNDIVLRGWYIQIYHKDMILQTQGYPLPMISIDIQFNTLVIEWRMRYKTQYLSFLLNDIPIDISVADELCHRFLNGLRETRNISGIII